MEKAFLVRIEGRVTGVGFRYSALAHAAGLPELRGYVRNVAYGRVESWVQGPEDQVENMVNWLRHGPSCAVVTDMTISPVTLRADLPHFTIE